MSENQVKKRRASICKSQTSKQRKLCIKKRFAHEETVKLLAIVTNFIRLSVSSKRNKTFVRSKFLADQKFVRYRVNVRGCNIDIEELMQRPFWGVDSNQISQEYRN